MNEIIVRLRFLITTLPKAERQIAQALLDKPEIICDMRLADLAACTETSDASVIRFCRQMGYDGYTEMKRAFIRALKDSNVMTVEAIEPTDSVMTNLDKVCRSNMKALGDTILLADAQSYEDALAALMQAKSIHFFGAGDAGAVCSLFLYKFKRLGYPGSAPLDPVMQLVEAGNMGKNDVLFAISYEGRTINLLHAVQVAKERGATVICITKMSKSPLLKYADIRLFTATCDVTVGRDFVARRAAEQMILDTLYSSLLVRREDVYSHHLNNMARYLKKNKI